MLCDIDLTYDETGAKVIFRSFEFAPFPEAKSRLPQPGSALGLARLLVVARDALHFVFAAENDAHALVQLLRLHVKNALTAIGDRAAGLFEAGKKVNIINEIVANVVSATILSVLSLLLSIYSSFYIYSLLLSIKTQTYFN